MLYRHGLEIEVEGAFRFAVVDGVAHAWADKALLAEGRKWRDRLLLEDEDDSVIRASPHADPTEAPNPRIIRIRDGNCGAERRAAPRPNRLSAASTAHNRRLRDGFAAMGVETDDGDAQTVRWRKLGDEAAIVRDYLSQGGWTSRKAGTTGTPQGAPRRGVVGSPLRKRLQLSFPKVSVEDLGDAVRRGRHRTATERDLYDRLCIFAAASHPAINHRALASELGVEVRTVDKIVQKGRNMTAAERQATALERVADGIERIERLLQPRPVASEGPRPTLVHFFGQVRCVDGLTRPRLQCVETEDGWEYAPPTLLRAA